MLLLHPPATKPCEPPAGIARLLGALRNAGVSCYGADLNLHVYLSLFDPPSLRNVPFPDDTWTRRAVKNRDRNFNLLRNAAGYSNSARYIRAVEDLNRLLLRPAGGDGGCGNSKDKVVRGDGAALSEVRLSLSDYSDPRLSPLRS